MSAYTKKHRSGILEAATNRNHMGYLKGKSTMIIFERFSNLKYKYGNRHFWCRGYYVSTIGGNKEGIARYIREREHEDQIYDQIALKEYTDPFKN